MQSLSETQRLADAVASIAAIITEIISVKVKEVGKAQTGVPAASRQDPESLTAIEAWVTKRDVALHFKISTVDNWMKSGSLPYIRTGKNVRFKLSEADEMISRHIKVQG